MNLASNKVSGSMTFVDSDSSSCSDEEDEDDETKQIARPPLKYDSDSEEEKLEVFVKNIAIGDMPIPPGDDVNMTALLPPLPSVNAPKKTLVELMGDAAENVAAGITPTIKGQQVVADGFGLTREDIRGDEQEEVVEVVPDMFGISYKPYKASKKCYDINSGNLDADDVNLQAELMQAQENNIGEVADADPKQGSSHAEDDFDFAIQIAEPSSPLHIAPLSPPKEVNETDSHSPGRSTGHSSSPSSPSAQAARRKEERIAALDSSPSSDPKVDAEEQEILASIRAETAAYASGAAGAVGEADSIGTDMITEAVHEVSVGAKKLVSLEAAQDAMNTVASIYASGGSGDMQARLEIEQGEGEGCALTVAPTKLKPVSKASYAITEEDEGEEEEDNDDGRKENFHVLAGTKLAAADKDSVGNPLADPSSGPVLLSAQEIAWENLEDVPVRVCSYSTVLNVTYSTLLGALQATDLNQWKSKIVPFEPRKKSLLSRIGLGSGPRIGKVDKLTTACQAQLDWPFLLAHQPWDPSNDMHLATLRTIFARLIPEYSGAMPIPATGPHWDNIGFQGMDPCTDINRAMKMFAVLQCLHITEPKHLVDARSLHALSILDPLNHLNTSPEGSGPGGIGKQDLSWPFFCVSISFTKEAIIALRTGELNGYCNSLGGVLPCLHAFHRACFYDFRSHMLTESSTHHAEHLGALRKRCADSPVDVLKRYILATGTHTNTDSVAALPAKSSSTAKVSAHSKPAPTTVSDFSGEFVDISKTVVTIEDGSVVGDADIEGKAKNFLA